jgi:putative ABC transport system permease protein
MPRPRTDRTLLAWFVAFGRDFGFSARALRQTPTFSVITITSLGFGLALAATALTITNAYLIRSLPYPDAERLYHLRYAPMGNYEPRGMNAIDWSSVRDVVESAIITGGESYYVGEGNSVQFVRGMRVSPGFFEGLRIRPLLGQTFSDQDYKEGSPAVTLLGHAFWRERFAADPNIVGREIKAVPENRNSNPILIRVVGVLPPGFWFGRSSQERPDMIVPLRTQARPYMLRLREGVPVALAESRITEAAKAVGSDFRSDWKGVILESVHTRYVAELRPLLIGVTAAAVLVLVLVCTNVAILILLRALRRQKEIAVRVALGAERQHLLRMLLAEASLISVGSLLIGLMLTVFGIQILGPVIETELGKPPPAGPSAITVDSNVVLMIGGIGLLFALTMAFIPLLASRHRSLADALRRSGLGATDGPAMHRFRSTLIALEVAGALVLLMAGGMMIRTVLNLVRTDLGFDADQIARIGIVLPSTYRDPPTQAEFYRKLAERLAHAHPAATISSSFPPFYETNKRQVEIDTGRSDRDLSVGVLPVGGGYFAIYGIALQQGREFARSDRLETEPVAIVSESLAKHLWPDGPAVGRRIRTIEESVQGSAMGAWRTIVGVVRDVHQTYRDDDLRDLYVPFQQMPTRFGNIQVRIDRPSAVTPARLAAVVAELDPYVRVDDPKLLSTQDRQFARARFMTTLMTSFAGFGTALALLGIYGVTAYAVQQREREIAIRIAVGASRSAVIKMFLREGGTVLLFGTVVGLGGISAIGRVLGSQIHNVRPFDFITLALAVSFLVVGGLLATWWPARRAAAANLLSVLKEE